MKRPELRRIIQEELDFVMNCVSPDENDKWDQSEPVEVPWEKAYPGGDENPAVIVDPEKIQKIITIARIASSKPPVRAVFEHKDVILNRISKGDAGKYKMYTTTPEGNILKLDFVKKVNCGEPLYEENSSLFNQIKPGSRVTIVDRFGKKRIGRAVMYNDKYDSWALNMGGKHGIPGIASEKNVVAVSGGSGSKRGIGESLAEQSNKTYNSEDLQEISLNKAKMLFDKGISVYIQDAPGIPDSSSNLYCVNNRTWDANLNLHSGDKTPEQYGFDNIISFIKRYTPENLVFHTLNKIEPYNIIPINDEGPGLSPDAWEGGFADNNESTIAEGRRMQLGNNDYANTMYFDTEPEAKEFYKNVKKLGLSYVKYGKRKPKGHFGLGGFAVIWKGKNDDAGDHDGDWLKWKFGMKKAGDTGIEESEIGWKKNIKHDPELSTCPHCKRKNALEYQSDPEGVVCRYCGKWPSEKNDEKNSEMNEQPTFAVPTRSTPDQASGKIKQNFEYMSIDSQDDLKLKQIPCNTCGHSSQVHLSNGKCFYKGCNCKNLDLKIKVSNLKDSINNDGPEGIGLGDGPLDGKNKRNAVKWLYKNIVPKTAGLYKDNSWNGINQNFFNELNESNVFYVILNADYQKNHEGVPSSKSWKFEIKFLNDKNKPTSIYGTATAHGAGSVTDPLSKYDVTVSMG